MSASETTPLLSADAPVGAAPVLEQAESSPVVTPAPADDFPAYFTRRIKLLTRFSLVSTIISALTLLAGSITIANGPFPYTWNIQEGLRLLGGLVSHPPYRFYFVSYADFDIDILRLRHGTHQHSFRFIS
jgi:hypothetical protein